MKTISSTISRFFFWSFLAIAATIIVVYLLRPISDPDFFWHLKTGEWIWRNPSLIKSDPFTLPPLPASTPRSEFILSSYWLSQLILYCFYAITGLPGILFYRFFIVSVMLYTIYKWAPLTAGSAAAMVTTFMVLLLDSYFIERPHFLSFLFLGAVLIQLFNFLEQPERTTTGQLVIPIAITMLLWGNMHGGFLVGQCVLVLIVVSEGTKFFLPKQLQPTSPSAYKKLVLASAIGIVVALFNPNPLNSISMFFTASGTNNFLYSTNLEYDSLLKLVVKDRNLIALLHSATILFSFVIFLCSARKNNITWLALLAMTAFMGIKHIRYLPFFYISAILCTSRVFASESIRMPLKICTYMLCGIVIWYCVNDEPRKIVSVARHGLVSSQEYPVDAADFIETNNLNGNIFNEFKWGGYLLWRFGEQNRIFVDGRQLYPSRYWEYLTTLHSGAASSNWKSVFDRYAVETVILPLFDTKGTPLELVRAMRSDKDWSMVYVKFNTAVFRRSIRQ